MIRTAVFAAVVLLVGSIVYLRLDKEHVFHDLRGIYLDAVTVEAWESAQSETRLLQLRNRAGDEIARAYYRRPVELDADYRILVMYVGAKTRHRILDLVPERPDTVLVSVQYPYSSPDGVGDLLRWPRDIRAAAFRTVAGGMLAVDFLERDEQLDIDRLAVIGVSVGVPFATLHGALDDRVPAVALIHGGGGLAGQVYATHEPRWLAGPASLLAAILFDSFEPLDYIDRIAPRKLVMVAARDESMLPVAAVERLFEAAGEPKQLHWTESDHVRSRDRDVVAQIIDVIDEHLANGSPDSVGN